MNENELDESITNNNNNDNNNRMKEIDSLAEKIIELRNKPLLVLLLSRRLP